MHSPYVLYTINRRKYQTKMAMPIKFQFIIFLPTGIAPAGGAKFFKEASREPGGTYRSPMPWGPLSAGNLLIEH